MQDLNKNQIVLLTLLISFVTSIATGIITVSLLQEAPLEVTRNFNRIVEKTIETVTTPGTIVTPAAPQKEVTTVVVKEEDQILSSINKNIKSIVRIKEKDNIAGTTSFYGVGLIISKDGQISTDRKTIITGGTYSATMSDGTEVALTPTGVEKNTNFILFKSVQPKTPYVFIPATFGDSEPQLGQTVISLGGDTSNAVSVGRVVSLGTKDTTVGTTTTKSLIAIETDVATKDLVAGSALFNLSGDLIGIKLSTDPLRSFTPISLLKKEISLLNDTTKTP